MSLTTKIYIHRHIPPYDLFAYAQSLVAAHDPKHRPIEQQQVYNEQSWLNPSPGCRARGTKIGQQLPAIITFNYGHHDRPLYATPHPTHDNCPDTCDGHTVRPACFAVLEFDTNYTYRTPTGLTCGHLHALYVAAVGAWLRERERNEWSWRNDFTGETHPGPTRIARLADLITEITGQRNSQAQAWLRTQALPAIARGRLDALTA